MNARYVSEMAQGSRVEADFLVRAKDVRTARTGDTFLSLELSDRTGSIDAVLFRPSRLALEIPAGSVATVAGRVTTFKGVKRVSIEQMMPSQDWRADELLASGSRDVDELVGEFGELVRSVRNVRMSRLLKTIFSEQEFFSAFTRCPATHDEHHCHIGGLIEHTVAVAGLCDSLQRRYDGIDRDVLLTAALLHDIGQVDSLSFEAGIAQTESGRLLGHVVQGMARLRAAADRLRIDDRLLVRIQHAVHVHHAGAMAATSREFPSTIEGLVLHRADRIDIEMAVFTAAVSGGLRAEEPWTDSHNPFGRPLCVGGSGEDSADSGTSQDTVSRISA